MKFMRSGEGLGLYSASVVVIMIVFTDTVTYISHRL